MYIRHPSRYYLYLPVYSLSQLKRVIRTLMNNRNFRNGYVYAPRTNQNRNQTIRRNNFVPNLNRNQRRQNLPIQFTRPQNVNNPRRNRSRNNRNNNRIIPMYRPLNVKTGVKYMNRTKDSFQIKSQFPIGSSNFANTTYVIPIHPLFLNQAVLNQSINYTSYRIDKVTLMTSPLVATTDSTAIAIGYTTHCTPISQNTATHWSKILALNGTHGMAHTPISYTIPIKDNTFHPIVPVIPSDIPFTLFITSQTAALDIQTKIVPMLIVTLSFKTQYTGDEIDTTLASDEGTITLNATGVQSSVVLATCFGFVTWSGSPNIDIGELISTCGFPEANTPYIFPLMHNNVLCNSKDVVADRGDFNFVHKVLN